MDQALVLGGLVVFYAIVLFVGLPYLQRRRQQRAIDRLKVGDTVLVLNAIYGKVLKIDGAVVDVDIAPKTRVRCLASAIRPVSSG